MAVLLATTGCADPEPENRVVSVPDDPYSTPAEPTYEPDPRHQQAWDRKSPKWREEFCADRLGGNFVSKDHGAFWSSVGPSSNRAEFLDKVCGRYGSQRP